VCQYLGLVRRIFRPLSAREKRGYPHANQIHPNLSRRQWSKILVNRSLEDGVARGSGGSKVLIATCRVAGPTWSATHLYVIAVAPTGAGKQHPIDCISALLTAAGAQEHFGPSSFMLGSALCNFVSRQSLSLCRADEFGSYLAKLQAKGASGHEREVTKVMRTLWGTSFGIAPMPEWADRTALQIHSPALSFFGTSTPDELFQALQGEAIENGLLNRFLVLRSNVRIWDTTCLDGICGRYRPIS